MSIQYSLIEDAFDYASFGFYGQSEAYINIDNDEIILCVLLWSTEEEHSDLWNNVTFIFVNIQI